jgi:hypothetical protein
VRDIAHGDRRLLDQQLRSRPHSACEQILAERRLAEVRIRPRHLPRRARQRPRDTLERERAAVVARDRGAGLQIQELALVER